MSNRSVVNAAFDPEQVTRWNAVHTEDRYKSGTLNEFGASFLVYDDDTTTLKLKLHYEEVLYVVEGALMLTVYALDETYRVHGNPGDVLTIGKGTTLTYTATQGTRLFVGFSPRDVDDLLEVVGD